MAEMNTLLEAIANMTKAMEQQRTQQSNVTSINVLSNFDHFDPNVETFDIYKERLEIHLQLKGVFTNKELCAKLLLQYVGASNYALLATLAAPRSINQLQYDEINDLYQKHFCPKKNILVEQHRFLNEVQNEEQSISDFVAVLQKRAAVCNFMCVCNKSISDIFCRAQFIRGIRDCAIREKLLEKPDETFLEIVEKAKILEAAKQNNNEIGSSSLNSDVHHMRIPQSQHQSSNRYSHRNKNMTLTSKIDYRKLGIEGVCLRCGRSNHRSNECKINKYKLKCTSCNKTGHVKEVCIKSKMKHKQSTSFNVVEAYSSDDDCDGEEVDNFGIHQIIDIYKSIVPNRELQKFFTAVYVEGKKQIFEVDSVQK
ncbi:uncharacterized protein LOC142230876 [Haematobia irritans]|uniref:uncharacterized protein LOC142230876 n=1 Tax=Haematobia irritans TaxID=7368 RepID=UPI003F4FDF6F